MSRMQRGQLDTETGEDYIVRQLNLANSLRDIGEPLRLNTIKSLILIGLRDVYNPYINDLERASTAMSLEEFTKQLADTTSRIEEKESRDAARTPAT